LVVQSCHTKTRKQDGEGRMQGGVAGKVIR
jgi:hypothetical protein